MFSELLNRFQSYLPALHVHPLLKRASHTPHSSNNHNRPWQNIFLLSFLSFIMVVIIVLSSKPFTWKSIVISLRAKNYYSIFEATSALSWERSKTPSYWVMITQNSNGYTAKNNARREWIFMAQASFHLSLTVHKFPNENVPTFEGSISVGN